MAAKQSKLWAYIIVVFMILIIGSLFYYYGWLKPSFERQIETATLERDYYHALADSCITAKSQTDTIWTESIFYDTVTFSSVNVPAVTSDEMSSKSDEMSGKSKQKLDTITREYQGRYVTEHFDLPWKLRAVKFESLTFLPYTMHQPVIITNHVVNCPPCPKLECKASWHLYGSVFTGYGNDAIFGAQVNYIHKKGWGVLAGYSTTINKHYGILGLSIKLK